MVLSLNQSQRDNGRTAPTLQQEADRRYNQTQLNQTHPGEHAQKTVGPRFPLLAVERTEAHIHTAAGRQNIAVGRYANPKPHLKREQDKADGGGDCGLLVENNPTERAVASAGQRGTREGVGVQKVQRDSGQGSHSDDQTSRYACGGDESVQKYDQVGSEQVLD